MATLHRLTSEQHSLYICGTDLTFSPSFHFGFIPCLQPSLQSLLRRMSFLSFWFYGSTIVFFYVRGMCLDLVVFLVDLLLLSSAGHTQ